MYTIGGITGAYPAVTDRVAKAAPAPRAESAQGLADTATFSPEAKDVATLSSLIADGVRDSEVRTERVEQAKEAIREGSYRVQNVVEQVAQLLTPYV